MPENQIQNLKNKIFGKSKDYDLIDIWHYLMIHYGWISWNEFIKEDAGRIDELVKRLNDINEKANKSMPKGRRGRR